MGKPKKYTNIFDINAMKRQEIQEDVKNIIRNNNGEDVEKLCSLAYTKQDRSISEAYFFRIIKHFRKAGIIKVDSKNRVFINDTNEEKGDTEVQNQDGEKDD